MTAPDGVVVGLEGVAVIRSGNTLIAAGTTHALVLRSGRVVAGPVAEIVSGPVLSEAFGMRLRVERVGYRFAAQAGPD